MRLKFLRPGVKFSIWAIDLGEGATEDCPASTFISSLGPTDQGKLVQLLKLHADKGPVMNEQKSRHLRDGIFEFKSGGYRILWFYASDRRTVLTHHFSKGDKLTRELDRAIRMRADFLESEARR